MWVRDIVTLLQRDDHQVIRGLMVDISEAKQTEQALRLPEQKFASVFQQCPDILIIARRVDGVLLEVNTAFTEQTGISVEQAIGKTATELDLWGVPGIGPSLLPRISALLQRYNLAPELLQLEITENFIMNQAGEALDILHHLKQLGVQLAIDDFGTGYSSLSYLKRLPLDVLKIDKSFVDDLLTDANDAAIARTILALAGALELKVVAEGVETEEQFTFLSAQGCQTFQGYLFGRPQPAEVLLAGLDAAPA